MGNFLELAKSKGLATLVTTVSATGGGAYKFEDNFRRVCWDLTYAVGAVMYFSFIGFKVSVDYNTM
jgi:pantothenate kinase